MAIISESRVFKAAERRSALFKFWLALTFDWNDELWDDWENLGSTLLEHIEDYLDRQESVWVLLLSDTLEEDWQVVMVVELGYIDFPVDFVLWSVLNGDWEISTVVESTEFRWVDSSSSSGSSLWLLWGWFSLRLHERGGFASNSHTLLQDA